MKSVGIMQPYFLPYIGYFQLMNEVDEFVIYDNIQFTKRGWFHRNRILQNNKDVYISLPIQKDSDYLDVRDRFIAKDFEKQRHKLLSKIKNNYLKTPYFKDVFPLIEEIILYNEDNLFKFLHHSIQLLKKFLEIRTKIIISSSIPIDHRLKGQDKVQAIVKYLGSKAYVNSVGGIELYDKLDFKNKGVDLKFIKTNDINYKQFHNEFIPYLSIIDVLMFNGKEKTKSLLNEFTLV
tara:strand:- start:5711 stop:6415 length:705 start_codon:yes stop_codon:yes gene_type:complete